MARKTAKRSAISANPLWVVILMCTTSQTFAIDNVEHIYQTNLGPGAYTLKVSGAAGWDYGLAWRTDTLFNMINADFDEDGLVTGSDFLIWQKNVGKLVGALHTDGDADGDGDVDSDDLTLYRTALAAPQSPPPSTSASGGGDPQPRR